MPLLIFLACSITTMLWLNRYSDFTPPEIAAAFFFWPVLWVYKLFDLISKGVYE